LTKRLGGRSGLAASLTVSLLLVIAAPIAAVVTSIVLDAIALVQRLAETEEARSVFVKLVSDGEPKPEVDSATEAIGTTSTMIDLLLSQGDRAWAVAQEIAGFAARFVIGLLVMVTGMYGILVNGERWYHWIEAHTPLAPEHFRRFGAAFVETGRGLWWGIVGAGLLQSIVATVAYLIIGVPSALALGMLTLLFSVIPAIGTAIIWAPVAAGLALTGQTTAAIVLVVIGVAVIGTVDNLARPYLARRGQLALPTWLVLTSMFGGVELFGGWGLVLGPLLVRLAKEALVLSREANHPATSDPPVESTTTS
jgi:predicted PurR-regulated permease PerM